MLMFEPTGADVLLQPRTLLQENIVSGPEVKIEGSNGPYFWAWKTLFCSIKSGLYP